MDIGQWLRGLGLGHYEAAFRDNKIDSEVLSNLTVEDLKELVLLCHDDPRKGGRGGKAWQHGQRMRVRASATVSCLRIVEIEFSICRSGRIGGASGCGTRG